MLWIQQITKKLVRGENTVSDDKIRATIYKLKKSAYLQQAEPI